MAENQLQSEHPIRYFIRPTHYFNYESEKREWNLEVHLPGVNKGDITAKFLPDAFLIEAIRDQAKYRMYEYFPFEIDTDSVKASYENGLLYVSGKIQDPMAKAHTITLS